jgi:hypothetical protein
MALCSPEPWPPKNRPRAPVALRSLAVQPRRVFRPTKATLFSARRPSTCPRSACRRCRTDAAFGIVIIGTAVVSMTTSDRCLLHDGSIYRRRSNGAKEKAGKARGTRVGRRGHLPGESGLALLLVINLVSERKVFSSLSFCLLVRIEIITFGLAHSYKATYLV